MAPEASPRQRQVDRGAAIAAADIPANRSASHSLLSRLRLIVPPVRALSGQVWRSRASGAWLRQTPGKDRVSRAPAAKAVKKERPVLPAVNEAQIDFETIELLFFAYRDFVSDPDAILARIGMGRAHHRVVYFVSRHPGMMVTDLLDILQITKQSLARVLKQLIEMGYIRQMAGAKDRRQRRLYPTLAGRELALALSEPQSRRITNALNSLSPEGRDAVISFLGKMRGRDPSLQVIESELD